MSYRAGDPFDRFPERSTDEWEYDYPEYDERFGDEVLIEEAIEERCRREKE